MATAKQRAAARRNIKKAQAALRKGAKKTRKTAKRTYRRATTPRRVSRSGMGPLQKGVKAVRGMTTPAANAAMSYGVANVPLTILTGRNLMHPLGGLHTIPQDEVTTLPATGPYGATDANITMVDIPGIMTGAATISGDPIVDTWRERLYGAWRGIRYNAKSSLSGDKGRVTTWGPLGVGIGAKLADNVILPAAENMARNLDKGFKGLTTFGGRR